MPGDLYAGGGYPGSGDAVLELGSAPSSLTIGAIAAREYAKLSIYQPQDADLGYPLLVFLEALGQMQQPVDDVVRQQSDGRDGETIWLDPERTPEWALDWLSMFPGVVYPIDVSASQKRQLLMQTPAQDRGTEKAIVGAARLHLADQENSRVLVIAPIEAARPLSLLVITRASETPDIATTERDIAKGDVVAAGVKVIVVATDVWIVAEVEYAYRNKTVAELEADFAGQTVEEFTNTGVI